jgi:hypothetical protein
MSYSLSGRHVYFNTEPSPGGATPFGTCSSSTPLFNTIPEFLRALEKEAKGAVFFSLSTPAVPFKNRMHIAVGHAKVRYAAGLPTASATSSASPSLQAFMAYATSIGNYVAEASDLKEHRAHPTYVYMMFWYTIDTHNGEITAMSDLFIPYAGEPYSVFFPSGLARCQKDYVIAYGVGDIMCKLAVFKKGVVRSMLKPAPALTELVVKVIACDKGRQTYEEWKESRMDVDGGGSRTPSRLSSSR